MAENKWEDKEEAAFRLQSAVKVALSQADEASVTAKAPDLETASLGATCGKPVKSHHQIENSHFHNKNSLNCELLRQSPVSGFILLLVLMLS